MNPCQNCGKLNSGETKFCRFCGTKFVFQQPVLENPYDYSPPRPYAWKTDEFQAQNEPRQTVPIDRVQPLGDQYNQPDRNYAPAPLAYRQQPQPLSTAFGCSQCGSRYIPRLERRISTAGWITFAVLLVFFFPLFWIGLLIKEDVHVCQVCNSRVKAQLYR